MVLHYFYNEKLQIFQRLTLFDTLVLGGGGLKGIYFLGSINFLEKNNLITYINYFYGTSIGAVICLFIILKFSAHQQLEIVKNKKILNLKKIYEIKNSLFSSKLPEILKQYIDVKITFLEFYNSTKKDLNVIAYNCTKNEEILFSKTKTPNFSVYEAICCSCSVPLLFDISYINDHYYIDGGIVNNLPINYAFDNEDCKNILVINIIQQFKNFEPNLINLINLLISVPSQKLDQLRIELCKQKYPDKKIELISHYDSLGINGIIDLNEKQYEIFFQRGYEKIEKILLSKN